MTIPVTDEAARERAARARPNRRRRIILLTHYFPPEVGAPQTRLLATAAGLAALGHEVRVVTGPPHYPTGSVRPGHRAWRVERDLVGGLPVLRLPMLPRPNRGFLDRIVDHASFAAAAAAAVPVVRWADVLLVEVPPLFLGATAALHRLVSRRPYVLHVADPWPDFPIQMGMLENPVAIRAAYALESIAYRGARLVTTVTPGLVSWLDAKPSAHGRVRLLPNGADLDRFDVAADPVAARRALGWPESPLTLVYAGSVGLAQGVGTLLEAVAPLADAGVSLRVVGDGFERDVLDARARARGLANVRFEPAVEAERVPTLLAAADAVVVMLRRGWLYERSLPTKLVEGLAAGRPVIVAAAGESARIVSEARAGYVAEPESPDSLRAAIRACLDDPARAERGRAGRLSAEAHFDRRRIVARLAGYLGEAAGTP